MGEVAFILAGVIIASLYVVSGVKVIRPEYRGVLETKGKIKRVCPPGTTFALSPFSNIRTINVAETRLPLRHTVVTKDGIELQLTLDVYYKVSELPESVITLLYKTRNYKKNIIELIKAELTELFLTYKLKDIPKDPLRLKHTARTGITPSNHFTITKLEFKQIIPPDEIRQSYLEKVKAADKKAKVQSEIDAEREKAEGIKKIEKEKLEQLRKIEKEKVELKKKTLDEIAKAEDEEIKLLTERWNQAYKENEKLLREQIAEGAKRSVGKVKKLD